MSAPKASQQQETIFGWFRQGPGSGNGIVRARAGTGKTWTIVNGIAHAPEAKIGYIVFNRKNRVEAQEKITDGRVKVNTGHSLGFAFIKFVGGWKRATPKYAAAVERDRVEAAKPKGYTGNLPKPVVRVVCDLVSWAKNTAPFADVQELTHIARRKGFFAPEGFTSDFPVEVLAAIAHGAMERAKTPDAQDRISYDDMVWLPVVMSWTRAWYQLLVIDEAQDTNPTALLLAQRSVKRGGRMLVVGDDRQAIYGFRGADSKALDRLKADLAATEFGLTITYRCPKVVVAEAQAYVPDYVAAPEAPEGTISEGTRETVMTQAQPGDAVLSRKNAPLMSLCLDLLKQGTPARIEGRDIGQQLIRLLQSFNARTILDAIERVNNWMRSKLETLTAQGCDDDALLNNIKDQAEVLLALIEASQDLDEVFDRLDRLFQDSDKRPRPAVVLSSVHKAKGLEWNRTFLLSETFKAAPTTEVSEEANIVYVAITRAKRELTWVADLAREDDDREEARRDMQWDAESK